MTEQPTQVLVVGAGPVGLTMAHELTRHGLRVRLVDAKPEPETTSRAIATHPRTLETYDQMGLVGDILERGQRIEGFTMFREGSRLVRLAADYSTMPTRFPFTVAIDQVSTEAVLRDGLARLGGKVEWGSTLASFEHSSDRVVAILRKADDSEERVEVPWLVGCDGGHSMVRKSLRLNLVGESSETWLIADAQMDTDLPRDSIYWIHTGGRTLMTVPMREPGRWRMLDTAEHSYEGGPAQVAERFTRKFSSGLGHPVTVSTPDWVSVFTFQQRMVTGMRVGRCFVAGDAAHVHSPASGQGMNTGIQEAFNLAWKLAMVEQGHARETLLDTYSAERVPVGRALLESTKRATFLVQLKNYFAGIALPVVFAVVRNVGRIRHAMQAKILGGVSALRLSYVDSLLTIAGTAARGPLPGERVCQVAAEQADDPGWTEFAAQLRDPRWTLLIAHSTETEPPADELARRHREWLSVRILGSPGKHAARDESRAVRDGLGLRAGDWLLIRPDGYLCARGENFRAPALDAPFAAAGINP